jgi:hypothetical protein
MKSRTLIIKPIFSVITLGGEGGSSVGSSNPPVHIDLKFPLAQGTSSMTLSQSSILKFYNNEIKVLPS